MLDILKNIIGKQIVELLVHISSMVDFIDEEDIIFFVDAKDDPNPRNPHPQKAFPVTIQPLDIQFFEGNDAL